ncbi:UNVERIFIED_CONTAM: Lysine-specific demethylase 5D [Trichonephila clavipes]
MVSITIVVLEEGGSEIVSRERRWSRIATRMGYPPGRGVGSLLRQHYERILYPYHVFQEGTTIGDLVRIDLKIF